MAGSNMVLMIISYPIYLKYLGVELFGLWATFSILLVFGQMGQLGVNQSIIKFVAESTELKDEGNTVAEYITAGFSILILLSLIFIITNLLFNKYLISILNLPKQYNGLAVDLLLWFSLLMPTVIFVQFFKGIVIGLGKVELSNYLFIIGDITKISLCIFLLSKDYQLFSLYFGWLLSNLLLMIIYIILSKKYLQKLFVFKSTFYKRIYELFHYGKYLVGQSILSLAYIPMIIFLITRNIGLVEVTYFNISWKIANSIKVFFSKGLQGIIPRVAKLNNLFKKGDGLKAVQDLQNIHKKSLWFVISIGYPIIMLLIIFSEPILKIWLGNSFHPLFVFSLRIFLISLIIELHILPIWNIFLGINKQKYIFISAVIKYVSFILFIIVSIFLDMMFYKTILLCIILSTLLIAIFLLDKYFQLSRINYVD